METSIIEKYKTLLSTAVVLTIIFPQLYGQIIYTQPDEPLVLGAGFPLPEIDVNNDGDIDLFFSGGFFSQAIPYTEERALHVRSATGTRLVAGPTHIGTWISSPAAHRFEEGEVIGFDLPEDRTWVQVRVNLLVDGKMWLSSNPATEPPDQTWRQGEFADERGFLGFELKADDDTLFGWVRIDGTREDMALYIHDWAYNTVPGEPIRAGEIPEPRIVALVMGLLFLVFVGAWRWRRRRT